MSETSEVIGVLRAPVAIDEFAAWSQGFPKSTVVRQGRFGMEARTPGVVCSCWTCDKRDLTAIAELTGLWSIRLSGLMILCGHCGHKRCPRATHHDNACTGSNDPGQEGSRYQ